MKIYLNQEIDSSYNALMSVSPNVVKLQKQHCIISCDEGSYKCSPIFLNPLTELRTTAKKTRIMYHNHNK